MKSSLFSIAIAAPIAAAALGWILTMRPRPGVTREHFEKLRPGMTQADVERLLHGPPRNDLGHTAMVWIPKATGGRVSARIKPDTPAIEILVKEDVPTGGRQDLTVASSVDFFPKTASGNNGRQAVWVTKTGLIAVDFGPDGKLKDKYTSTVDELVPPSFMSWIASRPMMIRRSLGF